MIDWLVEMITGIKPMWQVIILAAVPVTELRFSIPLAIAMGMSPLKAFIFSVVGNIMPVGFLLLFLEPVFCFLARVPFFRRFLNAILERTRKKGEGVQKYGALGLLLFVAIPIPGTGAWTGSLLAYLFGIHMIYALFSIILGVLISGILVTLATLGVMDLFSGGYFGAVLAVTALFIGIITYGRRGKGV